MMCPSCGRDTRVKETRIVTTMITRRTRICTARHQFWTFEVLAESLGKDVVPVAPPKPARPVPTRVRASGAEVRRRKAYILAHPAAKPADMAAHLGCALGWVYKVRADGISSKVR